MDASTVFALIRLAGSSVGEIARKHGRTDRFVQMIVNGDRGNRVPDIRNTILTDVNKGLAEACKLAGTRALSKVEEEDLWPKH